MAEYRRSDDRLPLVRSYGSARAPLLVGGLLVVLGAIAILGRPNLLSIAARSITGVQSGDARVNAPDTTFASLYTRYGVSPLSASIIKNDQVRAALTNLQREPCDKHEIYRASVSLEHAGGTRDAALLLRGYASACPDAAGELYRSAELFYVLGDYDAAIVQANSLARLQPENANLFYLRARAFQAAKRYQDALEDYATTIRLSADLKHVTPEVFMRMSETYAALGSNCEAIIPVEMYVALDPDKRATPSLRSMTAALSTKGSCAATFARGEAIIPRSGADVITTLAEVNGVQGRFIVDTGASFVTLTQSFAEKAKVAPVRGGVLAMRSANGVVTATLATASDVRVSAVSASTVPLVVNEQSLGKGVDGLLGMSFLSRFDITLTARQMRISAKPTK